MSSPAVQEFLVDYACNDGQVDFAAYPAVLAQCSPVVDAASDDPDEIVPQAKQDDGLRGRDRPYCRVLEATKHQHCLWSEAFKAEFPMSAIEESSFHTAPRAPLRRTPYDRASATKLTNFNKVNGLHHTHYVLYEFIVDHDRFAWSAPSAAIRDTRRLALPSDFEALLVALAGPQGLNSASGGFSPRRVPDQELVDLRRAVQTRIAALAPPPPSDARSDHHEKLFQATLALQRKLSSHLEADAGNSDSLDLVARSDEHLHDVATIASSLALGSRGEPLVGHILDSIPLTEFRGDPLVDFFGPGPAKTGTLHRSATGFAHGIDLVDPLPVDTDSADPEQRRKVLEQLAKTNCGFLDLLPVADHDRYPDCLVFLQEHLVAVCPAPVLVLVGASVGSVFLQHRAPIRKTSFDPSLEAGVAEEWLPRRPTEREGLPTWKALPMHGFSEVLGESIVVCVDEARDEWRLVIPQLHPGLNAYDPLLGVFRGRFAATIELKAMLAEEVLRRWPVAGGNQGAIVGLRTRLQELSAECGLEHALETMRSRVLDMGAMVMGERYAGKTKVVSAAGAAALSASTRRTNVKLPKTEGLPNGSRRRAQLKKIEELETEEVRRGVPVALRSTPAYKSARPGTEIYANFFLSLRPDTRYTRAAYGASGWAAQLAKMTTPKDLARYAANRKRVGELNAERQTGQGGQQWVDQVTSPHLDPVKLMVLLADSTRPRIERKKDGYYWARHEECGWEGLAYYRKGRGDPGVETTRLVAGADPVPHLSTKKGEGDNRHQVIATMNEDAYRLRQLMYPHDVLDRVELDAGEYECPRQVSTIGSEFEDEGRTVLDLGGSLVLDSEDVTNWKNGRMFLLDWDRHLTLAAVNWARHLIREAGHF
ncbi:BZ3500_MvSof-1268-A1-R1_Chr3-1g05594 [Microbotryum saponariae]|uniref:BZ3500_MvSof-1268-A1-R1_Chr3-1g05594 protein n=1 Tax=Microbotryum saponariae TaxID=289078 RepID=A0A2X0MW79_9BASI|nr:BZ3500_MvSof-1268-A1-R1_Chr3-1g05594 [Microbotryum saponariae]SDA04784.1 BZ3501_MvSof-1269-A2-R1_Chr3-1g05264 [Microbotryum saponariae]